MVSARPLPSRPYSNCSRGARGIPPPIFGHALLSKMAKLRLAMIVECTCRKRLRSLLTRHRSLSEDALAALMSKLVLNHVAASCPS